MTTEPPGDDVMRTQLCDWSASNTKGQVKLTHRMWLYSSQAGGFSARRQQDGLVLLSYRDVKKAKWAYLFIWPLSERLIAAGGIGAGWSAEPTGRSNVLGGLIWIQQAAVMGSGMSGGEREVGVYVTHKHKWDHLRPAHGKASEINDAHLPHFTRTWISAFFFTYFTLPVFSVSTREQNLS